MKRVLACCFILCVVLLAALSVSEVVNRWLILHSQSSSCYKTYRLFVAKSQDEIPLLGSSRALGNYVPSLISSKVFDYGINGSGMYETLFMLKAALRERSNNPILVNLDPWGFRGEYSPSLRGDYTLALNVPEVRDVIAHEFADRIPGVRFHGMMRSNLTTWLDGKMSVTRHVDNGAALLLTSRSAKEWEIINRRITKNTFSCHESWRAEIEKIARGAGRETIWIVGPCAPQWRKMYDGSEKLKTFLSWLETLPHMRVVNLFNDTADWGEEWFADPTHLNVKGAERFTKLLMKNLRL